MTMRKFFLRVFFLALAPNFAVCQSFDLKNYDDCGHKLNLRLAALDGGNIDVQISTLENPDNTPGWSYNFVRTPPSLPTQVDIDMKILLLGGISDHEQTMSLTAVLHMRWQDDRIKATDPLCSNFSAEYVVHPTRNLPWYPQWLVSNGRGEQNVLKPESWEFSPVVVRMNGEVNWYMSFEFAVDCTLDVEYFPFDTQLCTIDIESPQFDSRVMNYTVSNRGAITLNEPDSSLSPLWRISGVKHGVVSTNYPSVSFKFMLTRRAAFFVMALIIPTVAVNIMTALVFVTTANQDEKISSAMACVVTYFFIEILFFELSPVSSKTTPILSIFFTFHSYFALFVCCVTARLVYYAEMVEEAQTMEVMEKNNLPVDAKQKKKHKSRASKYRSPEFYNDICLLTYFLVALLSYIVVFAYLPIMASSTKKNLLASSYTVPELEQ